MGYAGLQTNQKAPKIDSLESIELFDSSTKLIEENKFTQNSTINEEVNEKDYSVEITLVNFESLADLIISFEKIYGKSSIELLQDYFKGNLSDDVETSDWIDALILFFGTEEIRKYISP